MVSWPILSVTTFLPLAGVLWIMLMYSDGAAEQRNARWVALWTTLITFGISRIEPPDQIEQSAFCLRRHSFPLA